MNQKTTRIPGEYGCSSAPLPEGVILLSALQRRPGRVQSLESLAQVAGVEQLGSEVHPAGGVLLRSSKSLFTIAAVRPRDNCTMAGVAPQRKVSCPPPAFYLLRFFKKGLPQGTWTVALDWP